MSGEDQQWDHQLSALDVYLPVWPCLVPSCRRRFSRHQSSRGPPWLGSFMVWDLLPFRWHPSSRGVQSHSRNPFGHEVRFVDVSVGQTDQCATWAFSLFRLRGPLNRAGNSSGIVLVIAWREKRINCICHWRWWCHYKGLWEHQGVCMCIYMLIEVDVCKTVPMTCVFREVRAMEISCFDGWIFRFSYSATVWLMKLSELPESMSADRVFP